MSLKIDFSCLLRRLSGFAGIATAQVEEFLQSLSNELQRRKFVVEDCADLQSNGIQGKSVLYPFVRVSVDFCHNDGTICGRLYFERQEEFDLISSDPRLRTKTSVRTLNSSDNIGEIARKLSTDALFLGAALEINFKRREIEKAFAN